MLHIPQALFPFGIAIAIVTIFTYHVGRKRPPPLLPSWYAARRLDVDVPLTCFDFDDVLCYFMLAVVVVGGGLTANGGAGLGKGP